MARLQLEQVTVGLPAHLASTVSLRVVLARTFGAGREKFQRRYNTVLENVSIDLSDGDRLGIVGANGAGKTTLLRCMAGIYEPSSGRVTRLGRTKTLLGAPSGLHIELTGYEFIRLSARIRHMGPVEERALIEDIEEFTELGDALDRPIRTYSSGMAARLSFAINTAEAPEILLMDEWMGAGDARFVDRANERLSRFVGNSSILAIATHADPLITKWCNKVVILDGGRIVALDEPEAALAKRDKILLGGKPAAPNLAPSGA